jgi:hypothetical protein
MRRSTYWFRTFDRGVIRESAKESSRTRNTLEWVLLSARSGDSGFRIMRLVGRPMLVPGEPGCGLVGPSAALGLLALGPPCGGA